MKRFKDQSGATFNDYILVMGAMSLVFAYFYKVVFLVQTIKVGGHTKTTYHLQSFHSIASFTGYVIVGFTFTIALGMLLAYRERV